MLQGIITFKCTTFTWTYSAASFTTGKFTISLMDVPNLRALCRSELKPMADRLASLRQSSQPTASESGAAPGCTEAAASQHRTGEGRSGAPPSPCQPPSGTAAAAAGGRGGAGSHAGRHGGGRGALQSATASPPELAALQLTELLRRRNVSGAAARLAARPCIRILFQLESHRHRQSGTELLQSCCTV